MAPEWEDATSYSRGERGNTVPRAWRIRLGSLSICVTRKVYDKGSWYVDCALFERLLGSKALADAKSEALGLVCQWCEGVLSGVRDLLDKEAGQ